MRLTLGFTFIGISSCAGCPDDDAVAVSERWSQTVRIKWVDRLTRSIVLIDWWGISTLYRLLVPVGDSPSAQVIRCEFNLNSVSWKDSDVVHPHLSADVGQNVVAVVQFHAETRAGEGFYNLPLKDDYVIFSFWQCLRSPGQWPQWFRYTRLLRQAWRCSRSSLGGLERRTTAVKAMLRLGRFQPADHHSAQTRGRQGSDLVAVMNDHLRGAGFHHIFRRVAVDDGHAALVM